MEKQRWEESEKRREEERRSEKRKSQKKEDAGARKGSKAAIHYVFPMVCGSGGSKSRLAKAADAEPSGQMRDEELHAVVARSTCASEKANVITPHAQSIFGSWDEEKVHAVLARSTCRSQNVQNTPCPDHFWNLRCKKSARHCGTKHMSKSTWTEHTSSRPLLEVETSKKCTPLWCEAHFEVKSAKKCRVRNTLDVQMSFCMAGTRESAPGQKWEKRESFVAVSTTHTTTLHSTPSQLQLHYITLH